MKDVIELAKQAGIRWDTDIDRSVWLVRRDELERFYTLVRNAALEEAAQKCAEKLADRGTAKHVFWDNCAAAIRNMKDNA